MMHEQEENAIRIGQLIARQLSEGLGEREAAELERWRMASDSSRAHYDSLQDPQAQEAYFTRFRNHHAGTAFRRVRKRYNRGAHVFTWRWMHTYAAAAVAIFALAVGIWLATGDRNPDSGLVATEILPGGNRATLTLADGRKIDLSPEQSGIVIGEGNISYQDGSSLGEGAVEGGADWFAGSEELVLSTPKGGTYQVILPDGSRVWLNAASTLRYPSRFSGKERIVELDGEAYFDIVGRATAIRDRPTARNAVTSQNLPADLPPFSVRSAGQVIQVLGTQFNVSAYTDEPATKTTLVEGKVQILNRESNIVNQLSPGEQGLVRGVTTETYPVEASQYTVWRNGKFFFDGKPFDQVMREVARWYDISVRYEGDIPTAKFIGDLNRNDNLATVQGLLEISGIRYRLEGRTLIITGKEVRP